VDTRPLIWVDLRVRRSVTDLSSMVRASYQLRYVREPSVIPKLVTALCPVAACFEYDVPGPKELEPLRQTRLEFPSLPVLMITVEHWEELAVWALRMRVCDYLVVPAGITVLCSRIATLVNSRAANSLPSVPLEPGVPEIETFPARQPSKARSRDRLLPALSYVEANYSEKVALGAVARLCGMGRYQFSRIFKRVQGTTFREFLIVHRINKAVHMLGAPGASITDVAFSVGFNDLSHFAQMFRRYVGVCPSDYLHGMKKARGEDSHYHPTPE
jgi:AraC-like DNA-binding protein